MGTGNERGSRRRANRPRHLHQRQRADHRDDLRHGHGAGCDRAGPAEGAAPVHRPAVSRSAPPGAVPMNAEMHARRKALGLTTAQLAHAAHVAKNVAAAPSPDQHERLVAALGYIEAGQALTEIRVLLAPSPTLMQDSCETGT